MERARSGSIDATTPTASGREEGEKCACRRESAPKAPASGTIGRGRSSPPASRRDAHRESVVFPARNQAATRSECEDGPAAARRIACAWRSCASRCACRCKSRSPHAHPIAFAPPWLTSVSRLARRKILGPATGAKPPSGGRNPQASFWFTSGTSIWEDVDPGAMPLSRDDAALQRYFI